MVQTLHYSVLVRFRTTIVKLSRIPSRADSRTAAEYGVIGINKGRGGHVGDSGRPELSYNSDESLKP